METLFTEKRRDSVGPVFYYVIYMVRRVVIVCVALYMYEYPMFQLLALLHISMAFLCYLLHSRPYDDPRN